MLKLTTNEFKLKTLKITSLSYTKKQNFGYNHL